MAISASRPALRRVRPVRHTDSLAVARRAVQGILLLIAACSFVAVVFGGTLLAYGLSHDERAFAGVSIAGVNVGGMTEQEIVASTEERFATFEQTPLEFRTSEGSIWLTPAELGISFATDEMAQRAFAFGRTGTLWTDTRQWLDALSGGYDVPLAFSFDQRAYSEALGTHLAPLTQAPQDATYQRSENGVVTIDAGSQGLAFDINGARQELLTRAAALSTEPIPVTTVAIPPAVSEDLLAPALASINNYAGGPLTLRLDDQSWVIDQSALYAMLTVSIDGDDVGVEFNRAALFANIQSIARSVYTPGVDASVSNVDGDFVVVPAKDGHRLNVVATVDAIMASLAQGQREVAVVTDPVGPHVSNADVAAAVSLAERMTSSDLVVTWDNGSQSIAAAKLQRAVRFTITPDRNPRVRVSFDAEEMRRAFGLVSYYVKIAPVDAELRWINGQVEVRKNEVLGRELDLAATLAAAEAALSNGTTQVAAITKDVQPAVTAASAASVQIRDLLASGETYYGNSVSNRFHNVELATSRVNGVLIPPGGVFSFNQAVGEVSINSGYRTGYGIVGTSNGTISTIPSVGGGICQVATTVFQAAFRAGMPIVERSWHLYWIPRYGQPPSGMKGLDATVDADYGLDMKFRNATNDWLAVVSHYDGANIRFELWGTNPGWEVIIDQPVITNVVKASQEMVYEENSQLPAGQTVFVEHAEDGFDASIHRVVRKDGQVIDEVTLFSTYAPARNVTLVGTG